MAAQRKAVEDYLNGGSGRAGGWQSRRGWQAKRHGVMDFAMSNPAEYPAAQLLLPSCRGLVWKVR